MSEAEQTGSAPWQVLQIGDWVADPSLDELRRGDQVLKIEPRKMQLLMALARRPGQMVSQAQLLDEVWADVVVTPSSVYQSVSQLRALLGDEAGQPRYIVTVPRKGYRLVAPVQAVAAEAPSPAPPSPEAAAPAPIECEAQPPAPLAPPAPQPLPAPRRRWLLGGALAAGAAGVAGLAGLGLAGFSAWRRGSSLPLEQLLLAVLPFEDLSPAKLEQPVAEGLADGVIGALARHQQLRVLARASAFQYRSPQALAPQALSLAVTHVLAGQLQRQPERLRLQLRLHRATDSRLLWEELLEVPPAALGGLALRVANSTLAALQAPPLPEPAVEPPLAEAYELYLLGLHHQRGSQRAGILKAREYFQRAMDRDPRFASAYVGQAMSWVSEFHYGSGLDFRTMHARAQPLLDRALQLEPQLPLGLGAQGHLKTQMNQYEEARPWLQQALAQAPHDATLLNWSAINESDAGRPREALLQFEQALSLSPLSFQVQHRAGLAALHAGDYAASERHYRRAIALAPRHANGYWGLGLIGFARGRLVDAVQGYRQALVLDRQREPLWSQLGWIYLDLGLGEEAEQAFRQAAELAADPGEARLAALQLQLYQGDRAGLAAGLQALKLDPARDRELLITRALLWTVLGQAERARGELDGALGRVLADPVPAVNSWHLFQGQHLLLDAACVYQALDRPEPARPLLAQAEAFIQRHLAQGNVWPGAHYLLARVAALRGQAPEALQGLERAQRAGWRRSAWWAHDPALAAVRALPGYAALHSRAEQELAAQRQALAQA